jgi:hypothetical protein
MTDTYMAADLPFAGSPVAHLGYDRATEESDKFRNDDTALMLFGFRFLRQVLFGENSIALNSDAAEQDDICSGSGD